MDRIQENQQQQDDLISDPNLLLAVAMVKSISSLIDYNQGSGEEQEEQKPDQNQIAGRNSGDNKNQSSRGSPDEMIELTPIQDLSEKVKQKKLLSKEELGLMTTCLQSKFADLKGKTYIVLNSISEKSAHQRLTIESLNLIKRILEVLSKKDHQDAYLYNNTMPIILKFVTSLQSKASYDQAQYRYLRTNNLTLSITSLTFLNQYLGELAPDIYGIKKNTSTNKIQIKQEEGSQNIIALPSSNAIEENDSLEKALEFVPIDYSTMTNMLSQHLQNKLMVVSVKDEEMSQADDEEEKQGSSGANGKEYIEVCKEHIHKLKILDLLGKSIDQMTTLYDKSLDSMLIINTSLFPKILRSLDLIIPTLKLKTFPNFLTKRLLDKFIDAQTQIINSLKLQADEEQQMMDIQSQNSSDQMQQIQQITKADNEHIKESVFVMAKCLEIMIQIYQTSESNTLQIKGKIAENFEAVIQESSDFKYLVNLIKYDKKIIKDIQQGIFSISQSLIQFFLNLQKEKGTFPVDKLDSYMIIITNLIRINKGLVSSESKPRQQAKKDNNKQPADQNKQTSGSDKQPTTSGGIRTRNQVKKEQTSAQKETQEKKKATSAVKQEEIKQVNEVQKDKKSAAQQSLEFKDAFKIDSNDVLKHCLSILIMMIPQYLQIKNQNGEVSLSKTLIKNLFKIAYYPSQLISRLVYGILAEFTKPTLKYTPDTIQHFSDIILNSLRSILDSNTQTVFTLKLLILLKSSDLNLQIAQALIQSSEEWQQKKTHIKTLVEIYEGQNMRKYMLYVGVTILINSNDDKSQIAESIFNEMLTKEGLYFLNLHLLQILMLNHQSIAKFKGVIGQFMIKLFADNEPDNSYVGLVSDIDKTVISLFNSKDQIYNIQLLQKYKENLDLQKFLHQMRNNFLAQNKSTDLKPLIISLLRQIIKINQEINLATYGPQSLSDLLKEFDKNQQNPFTNSQIDRTFHKLNQRILEKLKDNQTLNEKDISFLHSQMKLLQILSSQSNDLQVNILASFVEQKDAQDQNIGGVQDNNYAKLLFDFIKLTNVNIKGKIQQQIAFISTDENKIAQSIVDQLLLFKTIVGLQSQQDEDNLYSHTLSNLHKDENQILLSNCLLLKSLYSNVVQIVNNNTQEQHKDIVKELAFNLLKVKYDNPFLEYSDSSNAFDHDTSDKILQKSGAINLANKDFQKIRQLDQSLSILYKAQEYMSSNLKSENLTKEQKDQRKFILTLCNEVSGVINASSLKSAEDIKLLSDYLSDNGDNSQFFKGIMKANQDNQLGSLIWFIAFRYLDQSLVDFNEMSTASENAEDISEKKGGVQLTISFTNTKAPVKRGALAKRALAAKEQQNQNTNVIELPVIKPQPTINLIAQKLFNFLSDLIMLEKDSQSAESISTSYYLRSSFLAVNSPESAKFIQTLFQLNQVPLLKKIVSSLITNNPDSDLKESIRQQIFSLLIQGLSQQDVKEDYILITIEIAQIIIENNKQLLQFISQNILSNQALQQNSPTKFLILDFLCQLGQSKFSKVDGDQFKYNVQQIMDKRKKQQQEKLAELQRKKAEDQKRQHQEEQEFDLSSVTGLPKRDASKAQETSIDGFKQEKFAKDDNQYYEKYMEKPEDQCTFIQTKKDFKNQHWYFCYTCGLTGSNGCCAVCARRCHKGHHVVYSRKSNFFCDCGESGKCTSLNSQNQQPGDKQQELYAESRPQTGRRRTREEAHLEDKGLFFKSLAQAVNAGGPPQRNLDDGGRLFQGFQMPPSQGLFGVPPPSFLQKYELPEEDDEDEASLIFQHFGGILERPPGEGSSIFQRVGAPQLGVTDSQLRRVGQFQFLSESSEDDMIMREENEDLIDIQAEGDNQQRLDELKNMNRIMKLMQKESKPLQPPPSFGLFGQASQKPQIQRKDSSSSISQMSQINPLEDPLSDAASTPMHSQQFTHEKDDLNFNINQNLNKDDEMEDVGLVEEVCELLKQEQGQYDQVFSYLMNIIQEQISSSQQNLNFDNDEIMSSISSPRKRDTKSIQSAKQQVRLIQDQTVSKKSFKDGTFQYTMRDTSKAAANYDLNLLSIIDSNKDGLVAICEKETDITFYASSQFFDETSNNPFEPFQFEVKEGQPINKIETYSKINFNPMLLKFNPSYPYYLAVAGAQQLEILTLSKQGKVLSRLAVDLLLEIISKDLTIVNMHWLPGSQTMLAVATREFLKIYDLAQDNISPTHNFNIFNGYIADFTFGKEQIIDSNGTRARTTIYVASKNGSVYYQDFNYKLAQTPQTFSNKQDVSMSEPSLQQENDNSDIMLTKTILFDPSLQVKDQTSCIAIYFSPQADMLLITFQGGHTVSGTVDQEQNGLFTGFKINPIEDPINQATNLKTIYSKFGENLVCFKDIGSLGQKTKDNSNKVHIQAISRKLNNVTTSGVPVIIEISESSVDINMLRAVHSGNSLTPVYGMTFVKNSNKNSSLLRELVINTDGSCNSYSYQPLNQAVLPDQHDSSNQQETISKFLSQQTLIKKTDLPKEVKMPINFFEKMKNVYNDNNLKNKLQISGDIVNYFKTSKATFEALSKIASNACVIAEAAKKSIKMNFKLDQTSSDHVITGLRLRLEQNPKTLNCVSFKLFNRIVRLKHKQANIWFDLPFCDAEVIFGATNNLIETELSTDDVNSCPIKIFAIEVFAQSRKEFGLREKIRRIDKLLGDQQELSGGGVKEVNITNEEQVKNEMLKTKGVPLVTWKEKQNVLKGMDSKQVEMIETLDVIAQYIEINSSQVDAQTLQNLVEMLKTLLHQSMLESNKSISQTYIIAAVKRCLSKILSIIPPNSSLANPLNYQTIKDQIFIQVLKEKLDSYYGANGQLAKDLEFDDIRGYIQRLSKIYSKRHYQVFKIIEANPDLISKLTQIYLRLYSQQSQTIAQKDISNIVSLILANYYQQVNQAVDISKEDSIQSMVIKAYENQDLSQIFNLLHPFLINNDDQIQKLTISTILKLLNHYAKTAAKTLKYNQLPFVYYSDSHSQQQKQQQILIIDFAPHLIRYLFGLIRNSELADVAYSLIYKIIKLFEFNCLKVYVNFSQYLIDPIVEFINTTLADSPHIREIQVFDSNNKGWSQTIYVNLILINILMQESNKSGLKIKAQRLSLDSNIRERIINQIDSDTQQNLTNWAMTILNNYQRGFKEGKGSYRTKTDEGIPGEVQENLNNENSGVGMTGVKLLKPIVETLPWKWHPLFIQTDGIFEVLDRKIPTQIMLLVQFLISSFAQIPDDLSQNLIKSIREISMKKPASIFLSELGEQAIRQIIKKQMRAKFTIEQLDENALRDKVQQQINQQIKSFVVFQEFVESFEPIYHKFIKRKVPMTFNMQFQIHNLLQQLWSKASQSSANWNFFIIDQNSSTNLLQALFESALNLNEESSLLCLSLCALAFENYEDNNTQQSVVKSLKLLQLDQPVDLFKLFSVSKEQNENVAYKLTNMKKAVNSQIDLQKLIDSITLGRNKKQQRVVGAHLIKGIYETHNEKLIQLMLDKIPTLKTYGVNSQEFIAVLSYIINREIQQNNLTVDQIHFITKEIYNEVLQNNHQLTAHPNLELYSTLQRVSPAFQSSSSGSAFDISDLPQPSLFSDAQKKGKEPLSKSPKQHQPELFGQGGLNLPGGAGAVRNRKITNPYMLESEACSKCFEQRSLPFQNLRLNDVKTEAKYTDSTMIIKLNATYTIKQIQMSLHDIKGVKVIKTLNFYVNNKQGVDLADMKNNWNYWKRVKSTEVDVGQKTIIVDFALPINASNLLIEFQTVTLSKPLTGKDRAPGPHKGGHHSDHNQHIQVTGIDTVIQTLPKEIINKIGVPSSNSKQPEIVQNNGFEKENMNCPRCGKQVQGKHGICNSCGENALQCTFCRNINYEKPDAYLCNECGFSRFAKFDFSMTVKQGFASEKIENDEQRNVANQQIEQHLQTAQNCYQQLMKRRSLINQVVKRINEGQESYSLKVIQDMYGDECSELYQKMMKSLNNVKILKSEIDYFTQGAQSSSEEDQTQKQFSLSQSATPSNQTCFSCIQEYLKSQLGFLQSTAHNLSKYYKEQGFLDLLYQNNLRMHSISLQEPARQAICSLLQNDEELSKQILERLQKDLFLKKETIPAHLLSQNISQESYLVLDLLSIQAKLKRNNSENFFKTVYNQFWQIFFKSLEEGKKNASIADQITAQFAKNIKMILKQQQKSNQEEQQKDEIQKELTEMLEKLFEDGVEEGKIEEYFTQAIAQYKDKNFLIQCLILPSSQDLRDEAKDILSYLATQNKPLQSKILTHSLKVIKEVLSTSSMSSDQYFDILNLLLSQPVTQDSDPIYVEAFEVLFKQIDAELNNLVAQEVQKSTLGQDGFMPQLSTGQLLSRLVTLVSQMVKDSSYLKGIIQSNVNLVIKSFLKIRKLNLTKNKLVQNSEVELERMFKELHSENQQDKEKFILECVKIIEIGDCDLQEMRFLFEEICKVIDPVKPEPEYLLNLHKAQSQEFYFRGKMSKNPYPSTSLGKTMADVRIKICKEMELAEPELVELLVAGKIVSTDLAIKQVYEQVFWPALCKQRDPESYEIPNIEEAPKSSLAPMTVTFRLMGIDGEATEDRVETLSDGSEAEQNAAGIEKKYGITQVLTQQFEGKNGQQTNGINVLLNALESFGQLQKNRYLAEWLFKLITYSLKIKVNRQEFSKNKQAVGLIAKRLFESVGMQSQIEGQKGQTLFDTILSILEQIVVELNLIQEETSVAQDKMEIDQEIESTEAAIHVEIFIQIMADACNEMTQNLIPLEKTSKKIRAVSKILPFLMNKEDTNAIQIIADFIIQSMNQIPQLDNATNQTNWTNKQKFTAQFNLDRTIEILESTPLQKNFLKDQVLHLDDSFKNILDFFTNTSMKEPTNEQYINKFKLSNQHILRILNGLVKNHPESQQLLQQFNILDVLYNLTQAKFREKQFILFAQDIVESLTNKNHTNDQQVSEYLRKLIDQQNEEKKRLAQKKKEEIMRQMQKKKDVNKFLKQIQTDSLQEEQGPKCIVCLDGYTKKPTEVLGMYVFSKKLKISEMSSNNSGFVNTNGYTTVTHSNYIHFLCHQNAYRADASMKQPKKEWEGAAIRNDHTKCNNLFPMKGGNLPEDSYFSMVEKYFATLAKTVGQCDPDRVNVVMHDFKMLIKRLSYEDSFSRDTQGGGPEHNMHLIPFLIQMVYGLMKHSDKYQLLSDDKANQQQFTYVQEKRIFEFLEQGMKQKSDFMQKLEEEKKYGEIEEEEKFMDEMSSQQEEGDEEGEDGQLNQMNNFKLDQIAYQLTQCIAFCQFPIWENYKKKFLSIILCTISGMRDDKGSQTSSLKPTGQQTEFATGKKVLTISKSDNSDIQMNEDLTNVRRRRLSSDNKIDQLQRALQRIRPILIQMRLVDLLKQRWDAKRLGLIGNEPTNAMRQDLYLQKLSNEVLEKGNLQEVINECDEIFREYKDRMLRIGSVEEFLQDMGLMEGIIQDFGSVEQYVLSHF